MPYWFVDKRTREIKHVPAVQEPDFFQAIESLTGLDPPMAKHILASGKPIDHPSYEFHGPGPVSEPNVSETSRPRDPAPRKPLKGQKPK